MFIGLQGIGKSYKCARYARYQKEIGFKSAIVCGDTFASDACDNTTDPAKLASEGIEKLKKLDCDFIAVDTSGKQFHSICRDAGTSQYVARAFRESFPTGLAFITKITTNAKSLGTLTTVAATQCPMIFSTKGDKCAEFKELEPDLFARLLIPKEEHKTPEFAYTFRRMHSYFKKVLRGPKLLVDIPTMKLYIHIMDSMTSEELDTSSVTSERLIQISMQAEVTMVQARKMMTTYKRMATAWMKLEDVLRKLS
ncbi:hypothetical protein Bca101_028404 [Brassica carinata]